MSGDTPTQDALDGAALRRLREAVKSPNDFWDLFPEVDGWGIYYSDGAERWFYGATIADAVEKCLEALE